MKYRDKKANTATRWLIIGACLLGISLVLFVGLFFFSDWLQGKLERTVQRQSQGVYNLELYGFQVSPFAGSVSVDSLSLEPDYDRWAELQRQQQDVSRTLWDIQTYAVHLRGLNFFKMLLGQEVSLSRLEVQQPELLVSLMSEDTTRQHRPLHETVKGILKGLKVAEIDVDQARLEYRLSPDADVNQFAIKQFNLTAKDFRLDSQSFQAPDKSYYASKLVVSAAAVNYRIPDGTYRLTTDSLYINTQQRALLARQVRLNPTTDPAGLSRAKGKATSYMELDVPELAFRGVDYPAHSRNNAFMAHHLLITSPELRVFKDKQHFETRGRQPLPHELAQQMETRFLLDSVEMKNGYIAYAELVPEAAERGNINLQQLHITARNLTNMPAHTSDKKPTVVEANALVMGKVSLHLTLDMPLLNKNGYHSITGEIAAGNPEILNPIVAPTAFVRIKSGYVNQGSFAIELTEERATGKLHLLYSNFEVSLLSKGTGGEQSLGKKVLSKVANWVVVKQSNPEDKGEEPRVGNISVTRNPEKSVFSYWTDCLVHGFLSVAGLAGRAEKL